MRDEFKNLTLETMEGIMTLNYSSQACMTKFLIQALIESKGQIVFTNSIAGLIPIPVRTMYVASKFALDRFA